MQSYWMPSHVHACTTPAGAIVLDLKRDRYLGFGRRESEILERIVHGWPRSRWRPGDGVADMPVERILELCEGLLADGLLMRVAPVAPTKCSAAIDMSAEFVSVGDEIEVGASICSRDVGNFAIAFGRARFQLSCRSFLSVVDGARRAKRRGMRSGTYLPPDILQVAELVGRFRRLRAFVFSAEGHCLLHALTLMKFLSCYGFYPDWVIGVATQPWGAHAWVQWRQFLLDTNPEKVCRYTPILVI